MRRGKFLLITDLADNTEEEDLKKHFSRFGFVLHAAVMEVDSGQAGRVGVVMMATMLQAEHAVTSGRQCICGNYVTIRYVRRNEKGVSNVIRKWRCAYQVTRPIDGGFIK